MRIYNQYILSLALLFAAINTIMAALGQENVEAYFTVLLLASLVVTLLFVYLSPGTRRTLSAVGAAFFVGFMVIVALRVIDVVSRI